MYKLLGMKEGVTAHKSGPWCRNVRRVEATLNYGGYIQLTNPRSLVSTYSFTTTTLES